MVDIRMGWISGCILGTDDRLRILPSHLRKPDTPAPLWACVRRGLSSGVLRLRNRSTGSARDFHDWRHDALEGHYRSQIREHGRA